jgi:hypothetical protein
MGQLTAPVALSMAEPSRAGLRYNAALLAHCTNTTHILIWRLLPTCCAAGRRKQTSMILSSSWLIALDQVVYEIPLLLLLQEV